MAAILMGSVADLEARKLRDPESVYLEDDPEAKPVLLKVTELSGVYATRSLNGHVRNVLPGEKVQLVAYHPDAYFIREPKSKKDGWVRATSFESVDPNMIKEIEENIESQIKMAEAIKNHQVLAGMTFAQVRASLDEPEETAFRVDPKGRIDTWTYIEYERTYTFEWNQDFFTGRLFRQRVAVDRPLRELSVEFQNGVVIAYEQKKIP